MKPFLEHLNITSTDVDETIRFLLTAMPEFSIRGEGGGEKAQRWVHVGTEDSYLCVEDRGATEKGPHKPVRSPWNEPHADSLSVMQRRWRIACRKPVTSRVRPILDHPHRHRYYFFDS
ncbi:MAG: hypothetical protein CM1200mP21_03400 [Candidatus Poseidoniales archaeon]|nr:MAG: hypothetical protein CM1200mP21_03400 [Candidatus Poseidoniales archaeon]